MVWATLYIVHISRVLADHMMAWVKAASVWVKSPSLDETTPNDDTTAPMLQLVVAKSETVFREWEHMLSEPALNSCWKPFQELLCGLPPLAQEHWRSLAVFHVLEMASNFRRRFLKKTRQFPYLVLWLAK